MLTSLNVKEIKSTTKTSIDLVCVLDRSWSMKGEKLELVINSISQILDYLDEKDRLSVIVFDDEVTRICPLLSLNKINKEKIMTSLNKIVAKGGTNIALAVQHAVEVIKQRKSINSVTSLFLLSDGIQADAEKKIKNLLDREKFFIKNENEMFFSNNYFTINTFGYGRDHDANLMMEIARLADGNYYYVDNISLIDECLMGCLFGLVGVVAQNVKITFKPNEKFCNMKIPSGSEKLFSCVDGKYSTNIFHLIAGRSYNFLFEVEFNKNISIEDNIKQCNYFNICDVYFRAEGLRDSNYKVFNTSNKCTVMLSYDQDYITERENVNCDVIFHLLRLKAGDVLTKAKLLSDQDKYEEAKKLIDILIAQIKFELDVVQIQEIKNLLNDVEKVLIYINPLKFKQEGRNFLVQSYDSQLREKHNIIGSNHYATGAQDRVSVSIRQRKGLFK